MLNVMATPTKDFAVIHIIPKFREAFPRLRVMHNSLRFTRHVFTTLYTNITISCEALIPPFYILPIIKLTAGCIPKIKLRLRTLGRALPFGVRFIGTRSGAPTPSIFVILVDPIRFSASLTVTKKPSLSHIYNYTWETI